MSGNEQEPGPRGSPQLPQAPPDSEEKSDAPEKDDDPFPATAKTDSFGVSFLLWHFGHCALSLPKTKASNSCLQSPHMYSKIGIIAP
jgi:hypothetical protein